MSFNSCDSALLLIRDSNKFILNNYTYSKWEIIFVNYAQYWLGTRLVPQDTPPPLPS